MGAPTYDYQQYQEPIQRTVEPRVEQTASNSDIAKELVETLANALGDNGYWIILGLILAGLLFIFKKRIKRALIAFIKES